MRLLRTIGLGLAALAVCGAINPAAARSSKLTLWGVQCFLKEPAGQCKPGEPIRFQIKAFSPKQARDIANTAGQKSDKWQRCFKVSRDVSRIPACDPLTGQTIR